MLSRLIIKSLVILGMVSAITACNSDRVDDEKNRLIKATNERDAEKAALIKSQQEVSSLQAKAQGQLDAQTLLVNAAQKRQAELDKKEAAHEAKKSEREAEIATLSGQLDQMRRNEVAVLASLKKLSEIKLETTNEIERMNRMAKAEKAAALREINEARVAAKTANDSELAKIKVRSDQAKAKFNAAERTLELAEQRKASALRVEENTAKMKNQAIKMQAQIAATEANLSAHISALRENGIHPDSKIDVANPLAIHTALITVRGIGDAKNVIQLRGRLQAFNKKTKNKLKDHYEFLPKLIIDPALKKENRKFYTKALAKVVELTVGPGNLVLNGVNGEVNKAARELGFGDVVKENHPESIRLIGPEKDQSINVNDKLMIIGTASEIEAFKISENKRLSQLADSQGASKVNMVIMSRIIENVRTGLKIRISGDSVLDHKRSPKEFSIRYDNIRPLDANVAKFSDSRETILLNPGQYVFGSDSDAGRCSVVTADCLAMLADKKLLDGEFQLPVPVYEGPMMTTPKKNLIFILKKSIEKLKTQIEFRILERSNGYWVRATRIEGFRRFFSKNGLDIDYSTVEEQEAAFAKLRARYDVLKSERLVEGIELVYSIKMVGKVSENGNAPVDTIEYLKAGESQWGPLMSAELSKRGEYEITLPIQSKLSAKSKLTSLLVEDSEVELPTAPVVVAEPDGALLIGHSRLPGYVLSRIEHGKTADLSHLSKDQLKIANNYIKFVSQTEKYNKYFKAVKNHETEVYKAKLVRFDEKSVLLKADLEKMLKALESSN